MLFQEAFKHLKNGKKISRVGWYNKNIYLIYSCQKQSLFVENWNKRRGLNFSFSITKYIDGLIVPWLASQTDILSNDWEIVYLT
jgi:hypothetical protein